MTPPTQSRWRAGLLGLSLAIGFTLIFPKILQLFSRPTLEAQVETQDTSPGPYFVISADNMDELTIDSIPNALSKELVAGLHQAQWQTQYRGGNTRSIGHTQLVGPFQDPDAPPCSTSLLVSQEILDDGTEDVPSSPHTIASIARQAIEAEFKGMDLWPLGKFEEVKSLRLRWVRWGEEEENAPWLERITPKQGRPPLQGHLEIKLVVVFQKGRVPLRLQMTPIIEDGAIDFKVNVRAKLDLDNPLYQWVANLFDGNDRASRMIKGQLHSELKHLLDKPPPIPLGDGEFLHINFCHNQQIAFSPLGYIVVPFAIALRGQTPLPPLVQIQPLSTTMAMDSGLAVEIDTNGLNAILHTLWSNKMLDRHLANSLVKSFNEQDTVRNFLSLRLQQARFHLPPTVSLTPDFQLRAVASMVVSDGQLTTNASLFTQIDFGLDLLQPKTNVTPNLNLRAIELTCLPKPGVLKSCYSGLMQQVRANQAPLQDLLVGSFTTLLSTLLTKREFSAANTPGRFLLNEVTFTSNTNRVRAHLHGKLVNE